jgi:hypothetical protein
MNRPSDAPPSRDVPSRDVPPSVDVPVSDEGAKQADDSGS